MKNNYSAKFQAENETTLKAFTVISDRFVHQKSSFEKLFADAISTICELAVTPATNYDRLIAISRIDEMLEEAGLSNLKDHFSHIANEAIRAADKTARQREFFEKIFGGK